VYQSHCEGAATQELNVKASSVKVCLALGSSNASALEFSLFRISIKFLRNVYWIVKFHRDSELMEIHSHPISRPKFQTPPQPSLS
jgi:hypothetical protein